MRTPLPGHRLDVLIVDEGAPSGEALLWPLRRAGHAVAVANDGREAVALLERHEPAVVLLDETMAAADGWQLIRRLRENAVPAIMLVLGPAERQEKIRVLARGADGYLPKPVPPDELSAVVGACLRLLRRVADPRPEDVYDDGLVRMDVGRRQVTVGGTPVALTPLEFRLLHVLIRNRERVVSRGEILETTWHESGDSGGDHVKLYVHYLRRKLAEHTGEELIHTVRGFGYRWVRGERGAATDSAAVPA